MLSTIFSSSQVVSDSTYIDVDFSEAGFLSLPVIVASTNADVNTYITNLTLSTARINFSSKFSGSVAYIIREKTI